MLCVTAKFLRYYLLLLDGLFNSSQFSELNFFASPHLTLCAERPKQLIWLLLFATVVFSGVILITVVSVAVVCSSPKRGQEAPMYVFICPHIHHLTKTKWNKKPNNNNNKPRTIKPNQKPTTNKNPQKKLREKQRFPHHRIFSPRQSSHPFLNMHKKQKSNILLWIYCGSSWFCDYRRVISLSSWRTGWFLQYCISATSVLGFWHKARLA